MLDRGCSGASDVNWMKYSGGARDETHVLRSATLRRCTRSIGCSDWPAAASRSAVGLSGRSNAVKHERPAFIFIKRCLSATYAATGTLPPAPRLRPPAREPTDSGPGMGGQWRRAPGDACARRVTASAYIRCTAGMDTKSRRRN